MEFTFALAVISVGRSFALTWIDCRSFAFVISVWRSVALTWINELSIGWAVDFS